MFIKQRGIRKLGQETQKHITLPGHRAELPKAERAATTSLSQGCYLIQIAQKTETPNSLNARKITLFP